jgi:DNA modification methylase
MNINIQQGDCLELLKAIENNSIDLVLTSPPYDNLRKYNGELEWGEHVWRPVINELFRIVRDGGVVVWVVGDSTIKGSETGTSFKQALYFKEVGFNLHDTMIYEKSGIPFPSLVRYNQSFEYMFVFSKGKPKTFNLIADKKNAMAGETRKNVRQRTKDGFSESKGWTIKEFGIRNNIWKYKTGSNKSASDNFAFKHPAIFPESLAYDHIISWSNEGDMILDPFAGSGTVGKMARVLNRNCILMEKEEEYIEIIKNRLYE